MCEYKLRGLTIYSTRPICTKTNPIITPVNKDTLEYQDAGFEGHMLNIDNRPGNEWMLFIWIGRRPRSLEIFRRSLSSKCRLIKNKDVLVLLLKSSVPYGCLQSSMIIHTPNSYIINDMSESETMIRLDRLYEYMRKGGDINYGFGFLVDFDGNVALPGSPTTIEQKQQLYYQFTKPFIDDIQSAADKYEECLEYSLAKSRKEKVRGYISQLVTLGIQIYKEIEHTL